METILFESKGIAKRLRFIWSFAGILNLVWGIGFLAVPFVLEDFAADAELRTMALGGGVLLFLMGLTTFVGTLLYQASYLRIVEEGVMGIQPISMRGGLKLKQKFAIRFTDIIGVGLKSHTFGTMLYIHTEKGSCSTIVEHDGEEVYKIICERSKLNKASKTEE